MNTKREEIFLKEVTVTDATEELERIWAKERLLIPWDRRPKETFGNHFSEVLSYQINHGGDGNYR